MSASGWSEAGSTSAYSTASGARPIWSASTYWSRICSSAAPLPRGMRDSPQATLADAVRSPLILPGRPDGLRILVDSLCAEAGIASDVVLDLEFDGDNQVAGGRRRSDDPAVLRRLS